MKLSIITITRNDVNGLQKTLQSLSGELKANYEHIVINGGDCKETLRVIDFYRSRIDHCISEPDRGIYHAMNKGISKASGELVVFLNSGDQAMPKFVEKCCAEFENISCVYTFGPIILVYKNGSTRFYEPNFSLKKFFNNEYVYAMPFPHPSIVCRREVFQIIGCFDENLTYTADHVWVTKLVNHFNDNGCSRNSPITQFALGGRSSTLPALLELLVKARFRALSIQQWMSLLHIIAAFFVYKISISLNR